MTPSIHVSLIPSAYIYQQSLALCFRSLILIPWKPDRPKKDKNLASVNDNTQIYECTYQRFLKCISEQQTAFSSSRINTDLVDFHLSSLLTGHTLRSLFSSDFPIDINFMTFWASQVPLVVKNLPAIAGDARDMGSIPGSGRSPGGGNGNAL